MKKDDNTAEALLELTATVARLRAPDGCPWDRVQTHESLKAACIEEAAEVVSGINILRNTGKAESLCEELGDLLLQVVMHAQIAEEEGLFTLEDVIRGINGKMIRRHPHIFGKDSNRQESGEEMTGNPTFDSRQSGEQGSGNQDCNRQESGLQDSGSQIAGQTDGRTPVEKIHADWKEIKAREKQGREWEESYLFEAFTEAEALIDVARNRKLRTKSERES